MGWVFPFFFFLLFIPKTAKVAWHGALLFSGPNPFSDCGSRTTLIRSSLSLEGTLGGCGRHRVYNLDEFNQCQDATSEDKKKCKIGYFEFPKSLREEEDIFIYIYIVNGFYNLFAVFLCN